MDGTIVNNSQTNVQVYATRTKDSSGKTQPNLKALSREQVPVVVVGTGSSADLPLVGEGDYIYCGLWEAEAHAGPPDSWIIFSTDNKVVQSDYNEYVMTVGIKDTVFIITVTEGPGGRSPRTTGASGMWIIILAVLMLLVIVSIGAGILFLRKPSTTISANPFAQTDIPLIT